MALLGALAYNTILSGILIKPLPRSPERDKGTKEDDVDQPER